MDSAAITFLWRMLHDILPTRSRLHHLRMPHINNPNCQKCNSPDTVSHNLAKCQDSEEVFLWLQTGLNKLCGNLSCEDILLLNFPDTNTLALVWLTAEVLQYIWIQKSKGKRPMLHKVRSEIEAKNNLLRCTKISYIADTIKIMI